MSRLLRLLLAGFGIVVVLGVIVAIVLPSPKSTSPKSSTSTSTTPKSSKSSVSTAPVLASTFLGSNGVEARWVVQQNELPGTTAWRITSAPRGATITGYANLTYASVGQSVTLYVSTNAPSFQIAAYRMGYYGGAGARLIWSSKRMPGRVQPSCPVTPGTHMVACDNWSASTTIRIGSSFVQGDYLLKLTGSDRQQSYVPLTIWDPGSHATYLVKNDVFTWEAWNPYGGDDFYQGTGHCAPTYPPCARARVVSYDRPYGYGEGAADFLANEYPLVRFAEQHGLDVTYVTDVTVEQHPAVLEGHSAVLSLGHDECWSFGERTAALTAERAGVNLVFFAASAVLRHVRLQASPRGPDREVVDYRDSTEDPLDGKANPRLVTGNTWSSAPASWPETAFVGATYAGYLEPGAKAAPFVVADAASWLFRGTGLHTGSVIPGTIASDFDEFEPSMPHQADEEIFGHSPIPTTDVQTNIASGRRAFSDMTYYTDATSHAGVFDSGTNNWIPALAACTEGPRCRARTIARITGNLLVVVGQGPAGLREPSVANWQRIYH